MNEMTPEKLRKLAENKQSVHFTHVLAAASAWEKNLQESNEYARLWHRDATRIEALRRDIDSYRRALGMPAVDWAALAAEEKQPNAACGCLFSTATGTVDTTGCSFHGSARRRKEKK